MEWQPAELIALLKAGRTLRLAIDSASLFEALGCIVQDRFAPESVSLFLYEAKDRSYRSVQTSAAARAQLSFKCEDLGLHKAIESGRPFRFSAVAESWKPPAELEGLRSAIWAPLTDETDGKPTGLITLGPLSGGQEYSPRKLAFVHQLAKEVSTCLTSCRAYDRKAAENKRLEQLLHKATRIQTISRSMTIIEDSDSLYGYILRQVLQITEGEEATLLLFDRKLGELQIRAAEGIPDEEVKFLIDTLDVAADDRSDSDQVAKKVFETGAPIYLDRFKEESEFVIPGKGFVKSLACIPLSIYGETMGVITVVNRVKEGGFSSVDKDLLAALADQAALAVNKAHLWEMATLDLLTGLPIRRLFFVKAEEELERAKRYGRPVSIAMADIDLFKKINDNHGHATGDEVLRVLGGLLRAEARESDMPARFGGEEFAILLPETDQGAAFAVAERIRKSVASRSIESLPKVTVSLGVATYPQDADAIKKLLDKADAALYSAKKTGRNRVVKYSRELEQGGFREKIANAWKRTGFLD
jgi:diguanylate cyclase (GGDEF)-like protein